MTLRSLRSLSILAALACPVLAGTTGALASHAAVAADDEPTMDAKAEKIWKKALKASLGEAAENPEKVENIVSKGTMSMPGQGISAPIELIVIPNEGLRVMIEIPGMGQFEQGLVKDVAWSNNMMQGPVILEGGERDQIMEQGDFFSNVHWDKYYNSITYQGEETITLQDGTEVDTHVLVLDSKTAEEDSTQYFNKETGVVVKQVTTINVQGAELPSTTYMMDYRDIDGMMVPFKTVTVFGPQQQVIEFESVEFNADLQDDVLTPPQAVQEIMEG